MSIERKNWQFPFDAISVILGYFSYSQIFQKWIEQYGYQVDGFFGVNAIFFFLLVFFLAYGSITRFLGYEFDILHRIRTYIPIFLGALLADFVDLIVLIIAETSNLNILTGTFLVVLLFILNFARITIFILTFELGSRISSRILKYYKESQYSAEYVIFTE